MKDGGALRHVVATLAAFQKYFSKSLLRQAWILDVVKLEQEGESVFRVVLRPECSYARRRHR
jgi:hypothetical protein